MIAAGVGNPPAPASVQGAWGVFKMEGQKRPTLAFRLPHAYPPGTPTSRPSSAYLTRLMRLGRPPDASKKSQDASKTAQDAAKMA